MTKTNIVTSTLLLVFVLCLGGASVVNPEAVKACACFIASVGVLGIAWAFWEFIRDEREINP
jgi:uncharacterized membrane protein YidH (DUF202 family)